MPILEIDLEKGVLGAAPTPGTFGFALSDRKTSDILKFSRDIFFFIHSD